MKTKPCPICQNSIPIVGRYPNYICQECTERVVSVNDRPLKFYNQDIWGGFLAFYADTDEPYYPSQTHAPCFIDGVACVATEARMGGIVIQVQVKTRD
ncbi:MAG: hypothetical protein KKD28_12705 [Chloroflexi bacterium]|nr:hypothetical protein [Chloroflexota bacterium]MBU1662319.1 hypothetical protein [Chloroflexota bacterium]